MAEHNVVGKLGEDIAERFLKDKGFTVIGRNFWRPYGEIDIISRESSGKYRFIEVKSVSWETSDSGSSVPYETGYRPEENVHPQKIKRLMRVIETYVLLKRIEEEWQFDILAVYIDRKHKKAKVRHLENIILGS